MSMAHDVFDDHNRVIHQNTDAEDERKEGDPVERVPVEIKNKQG